MFAGERNPFVPSAQELQNLFDASTIPDKNRNTLHARKHLLSQPLTLLDFKLEEYKSFIKGATIFTQTQEDPSVLNEIIDEYAIKVELIEQELGLGNHTDVHRGIKKTPTTITTFLEEHENSTHTDWLDGNEHSARIRKFNRERTKANIDSKKHNHKK